MNKIVNLLEFKANQEYSKQLECEYQKFLSLINRNYPLPKSFYQVIKFVYFSIRYLEGNINIIPLISILMQENVPETDIQGFKDHIIEWLQDIIEQIKDL